MSSRLRFVLALVAAACAGASACADFSRGPASASDGASGPTGGQDGSADGGALSFGSSVEPLLLASCQRCHAAGGEAGDTQLVFTGNAADDYVTVSRLVDTASAAGSRLLSKASGNGHGGGTVFATSSPEYQTVLQWIQRGAHP